MNKAVLSVKYPQFAKALEKRGYEIIPSENVDCFIEYEQDHADLQCLVINDTAFVLSRCKKLANALKASCNTILCADNIGRNYPSNVVLSAVLAKKKAICRSDSLDDTLKRYLTANNYEIINVNQGYTRCSCANVGENGIITADKGIYKALEKSGFDVLLIEEGRVMLHENVNGFIGGASGYDPEHRILYFCGDFSAHPSSDKIIAFCEKHNVKPISLTEDILTDIGGIIFC